MALSPQDIANKQVANATADKFSRGVDATQGNPMEAAAQQESAMLAGVTDAVQSGRWAQALRSVSPETWKARTKAKAGNYATGVQAAKNDIAAFHQEFQPHVQAVRAQVKAMPKGLKGGPESEARMLANMRGMAQFKRSSRRR